MKLIDKDVVLAEIERRIRVCGNCYILDELASLHRTFDSLEVEEVDLEKESISWRDIPQLISIAERFRTDVYISTKRITPEDFYKEVLKRFKTQKGK